MLKRLAVLIAMLCLVCGTSMGDQPGKRAYSLLPDGRVAITETAGNETHPGKKIVFDAQQNMIVDESGNRTRVREGEVYDLTLLDANGNEHVYEVLIVPSFWDPGLEDAQFVFENTESPMAKAAIWSPAKGTVVNAAGEEVTLSKGQIYVIVLTDAYGNMNTAEVLFAPSTLLPDSGTDLMTGISKTSTVTVRGNHSMVSVTADLDEDDTILMLAVDAANEQMGMWCENLLFTSQFIGKKGPFTLGEGIDAVTGATVTSRAVVEAVNLMYTAAEDENTEVTVTDGVGAIEVFETEKSDAAIQLDELLNEMTKEHPELDFEIEPVTDTPEPPAMDSQPARQTETTTSFGLGEYVGFGGKASSTGFKYKDLEDGTIQISDYTGSDTDIVIPAEIDGKRVSVVGDIMGFNSDTITSITIQEGPTEIADYAFTDKTKLTSVTLPSSLRKIGGSAFYGCEALKTVTIPYGVTQIGEAAFSQTGLTSVTIPGSVKTIEPDAFSYCYNLTTVVIEEGVQSIGKKAFIWCESLTGITLPASLTEIGDGAIGSIEGPDGGYYPMGGVTVYAPSGSYAARYCQNLNINWKAK